MSKQVRYVRQRKAPWLRKSDFFRQRWAPGPWELDLFKQRWAPWLRK